MGHDDYDDHHDEPKKGGALKIVLIVLAVCAALFVMTGGICAVMLLPALTKAKAKANQTKCSNNLRQIGLAAVQYADDKRFYVYDASGDISQTLATLEEAGYLENSQALACPEVHSGPSYEGMTAPYSRSVRSNVVMAWDVVPHLVNGEPHRNVLFADCTVQFVAEEEFEDLRKAHDLRAEKVRAAYAASQAR